MQFYIFVPHWILSYFVGLVFTLLVESPVMGLQKLLMQRLAPHAAVTSSASTHAAGKTDHMPMVPASPIPPAPVHHHHLHHLHHIHLQPLDAKTSYDRLDGMTEAGSNGIQVNGGNNNNAGEQTAPQGNWERVSSLVGGVAAALRSRWAVPTGIRTTNRLGDRERRSLQPDSSCSENSTSGSGDSGSGKGSEDVSLELEDEESATRTPLTQAS